MKKRMKKNVKKLTVLKYSVALLTCVFLLTGCSGTNSYLSGKLSSAEPEGMQSVSMVLGVHDFFPSISLAVDAIYSPVYNACYTYGKVSGVIVDGAPYVAGDYKINPPGKNIDKAKKKQIADNSTKQILAEIATATAKTPEIDTLSAITLSAGTLQSTKAESQKTMIVIDSGFSSSGLLDFSSKNIIDASVETVVEQLKELHAIPDLNGISVTWIGLGTTCGEQEELTSTYKYKLKELWNAILSSGGATVTFDSSPMSKEEYAGELPECTAIPIVAESLNPEDAVSEGNMPEVVKYDENTTIKFQSDKSEFVDRQATEALLEPIAQYLIKNPDKKIYIAGMTATVGEEQDGKVLALERARACRDILTEKGVQAGQLTCMGLGHAPNPLRVTDTDGEGNLLEDMAKLNRAVFFIQSDSKLMDVLGKIGMGDHI